MSRALTRNSTSCVRALAADSMALVRAKASAPSTSYATAAGDVRDALKRLVHASPRIISRARPDAFARARGFAVSSTPHNAPRKLYTGPQIKLFRVLVRFKLAQLVGVGGLATPALTIGAGEAVSNTLIGAAVATAIGSVACGAALQYYASRYVGELALVAQRRRDVSVDALRISTMDFWGNRVDEIIPMDDVVPPLKGLSADALEEIAAQMFIPLDVVGGRQYVLSLRHGNLRDRDALFDVLSAGEYGKRK